MNRELAKLGAAFVALQVACHGVLAVPANEAHQKREAHVAVVQGPRDASVRRVATRHHRRRDSAARAKRDAVAEQSVIPPSEPVDLSDQEQKVSQIAAQNGDRDFLMVDKVLGRIILFDDNAPIYSASALTGKSTGDRLPPNALSAKFSALSALEDKVTPAGRYTVTRSYDKDYGPVLDINEIHGKDWGIAIHKVYLGTPSEQRDLRLKSPNEEDKHITFGCINVEPDTFNTLVRYLPKKRATPLYILPQDETRTAAYFKPRSVVADEPKPNVDAENPG